MYIISKKTILHKKYGYNKHMIHTLKKDSLEIKIDSIGAQPMSIKDVETGKEYIYQKNTDEWAWSAPIMFPQCGNFPDGFDIEGTHYALTNHGFLRDQDFSVKGNKFSFTSNEETYKIFPFHFKAEISFIIKGKSVKQQVKLTSLDDRDIPYSIGFHTGYIMHYPTMTTSKGHNVKFDDEYLSSIKRYFEEPKVIYIEDSERKIKITAADYTTLLIWAHPQGKDHMVCVEPRIDTDKENSGYPFKNTLKKGKSKFFSQTIEILK